MNNITDFFNGSDALKERYKRSNDFNLIFDFITFLRDKNIVFDLSYLDDDDAGAECLTPIVYSFFDVDYDKYIDEFDEYINLLDNM